MLADANNLQDGELQRMQIDARRVGQRPTTCLKRIEALKTGFDVTRDGQEPGALAEFVCTEFLSIFGQHCRTQQDPAEEHSVVLPDLQKCYACTAWLNRLVPERIPP